MQVILDSSFALPGSDPIWGGKKREFRDWTMVSYVQSMILYQFYSTKDLFWITAHKYRVRDVLGSGGSVFVLN